MEIEIHESRGRISRHTYLTPTGIARKMDVPDSTVAACLKRSRVPIEVRKSDYNGRPEHRINAEYVLSIVDCIINRRMGNYPDLEQRVEREEGTVIEVNPAQRPQNFSAVRRGRQYYTRMIMFRR